MAKQHRIQQLQADKGGIKVQNSQIEDDNYLPPAEEIEKYHAIDPTILDFIKDRAEKEQNHRHKKSDDRTEYLFREQFNTKILNLLGLIFGFIVIMTAIAGSYYLIIIGHEGKGIAGFFGTVIFAAALLITRNIKVMKTYKSQE